jgi:hypothetical protein
MVSAGPFDAIIYSVVARPFILSPVSAKIVRIWLHGVAACHELRNEMPISYNDCMATVEVTPLKIEPAEQVR